MPGLQMCLCEHRLHFIPFCTILLMSSCRFYCLILHLNWKSSRSNHSKSQLFKMEIQGVRPWALSSDQVFHSSSSSSPEKPTCLKMGNTEGSRPPWRVTISGIWIKLIWDQCLSVTQWRMLTGHRFFQPDPYVWWTITTVAFLSKIQHITAE